MPAPLPSRRLLAALLPLALLATPALAAEPTVVHVTLDNMGDAEIMRLDRTSVPAGPVRFEVTNQSADQTHELIVVRTDLTPEQFPTTADARRVDEDRFQGAEELEDIRMGGAGELLLDLKPGHYVLFCNLKNHFKDGMNAELTVTG